MADSVFNDDYVYPAISPAENFTPATPYDLVDNITTNIEWNDLVSTESVSFVDDDLMCDGFTQIEVRSQSLPVNDHGNYSISDFVKEMAANSFSWKPPASNRTNIRLWVFWKSNHLPLTNFYCIPNTISVKIRTVLFNFMLHSTGKLLAQFWAPKIIAGRRTLTTLDQPFGVYGIDREFCGYIKKCMDHKIDVDSKIEDDLGLPGRVFRYAWPEFTPDVTFYSIQEYPLRDSAVRSGVKRALALPIFESFDGGCVGVLEIVDAEENVLFSDILAGVHLALKTENLESSYMYLNSEMHTQKCPPHAFDEIQKILEVVGAKHKLPLAQTWVKRNQSNTDGLDRAKGSNSFRVKCTEVVSTNNLPYYELDALKTSTFRISCKEHLITKGQGVVGKVFLDCNLYFCRDVAQLSPTRYPFAIYARSSGLSACFAICLHNIFDASEHYVLEFFLPPCNAQCLQTLLESIFTTVKQHLRNFKVYSGGEGEELSIEVIKMSLNDELDSFKLNISGISATSSEILYEGEEQRELDSSGFQVTKYPSTLNMKNVERNASRTCSRCTFSGVNSSKEKHEDTEISISYEAIKQHFDMKLANAAESLGVSRSTLKRICRKYDIFKWPNTKRKKGNHSLTNCSTKNICEFDQGVEDRIPDIVARDPLDPTPPKEATYALTPVEDQVIVARVSNRPESNVIIKAFYEDDIIKFTLSLSSGMTELVENVAKRLKLKVEIVRLKFEDDDGDMITITCDENVEELFSCSRLRGKAIIKVSVVQDTNQVS